MLLDRGENRVHAAEQRVDRLALGSLDARRQPEERSEEKERGIDEKQRGSTTDDAEALEAVGLFD
jgi:hypothetical protein